MYTFQLFKQTLSSAVQQNFCCLRSRKCEAKPEQTVKRSYELEYECISPFLPGISNMCFCLTACELDINLRRSSVEITWNLTHILKLRGSKIFSFKNHIEYDVMCFHSSWQSRISRSLFLHIMLLVTDLFFQILI